MGRDGDDGSGDPVHALASLSPREVGRRFATDPRLLLAVGTLDPLDDHLPLGAGTRVVEAVVREVSTRHHILRAPPFAYGGVTGNGKERPGSAGLQRKTLHRAVNDLLGAWEDHGVEEFILVTAQRSEPHMDALLMAFTSEARTTVFDLLSLDISDLAPPDAATAPHDVEGAVLAYLDTAATYDDDGTATPSPGVPPAAERGRAIFRRWVDLILEVVPPGRGPAPSEDV
jgi:creatinine amidohydrolase/Fe(II)-dependent formamide hydrolase-like protein